MRRILLLLLATPAFAGPGSVTQTATAPVRVAPSGKAKIQHLAQGKNAYFGRLELAAGAKVPEHQDTSEEIIYVLQGSGVLTIDGVQHQIGPGSTILMPAKATVSYANGPATFVGLQVFAGPGSAGKYTQWKAAPSR